MLRLPTLLGSIDRRILVNYRVDADIAARLLPSPFRPKRIAGYAIAGICLIRLKQVRPAFLPWPAGFGSENAAHRFAVEWTDADGTPREGVYIPRRDTNSRVTVFVGGRLFPGEHHHARFDIDDASDDRIRVRFASDDGSARVRVDGHVINRLPMTSLFASLDAASRFFEAGSLGYSATTTPGRFDGLELQCDRWAVRPLAVDAVESSLFDDPAVFPRGAATFDCALLMRGIDHAWRPRPTLSAPC